MKKIFLLIAVIASNLANAQAPKFSWGQHISGPYSDVGQSIATDASGNVYTIGGFGGTIDFDPGTAVFNVTSTGDYDLFVSKIDTKGKLVWAKNIGGVKMDYGNRVAIDVSGNVLITGTFQDTVDFDPGAGINKLTASTTSKSDIFILKLNPSGNFAWAKKMGNGLDIFGNSVVSDLAGNVYTTGYFSGTLDFDPGSALFNLIATGNRDIFISKLDKNGNFVWAKSIGGSLNDMGSSLQTDKSGNIYTAGNFEGTADFDPDQTSSFNLTSAGGSDIFILKLNSSGNFVWAKKMGGSLGDGVNSMVLDTAGKICITGSFSGTADFNPDVSLSYNFTSMGGEDIFIAQLDKAGDFIWAKQIGAGKAEKNYSMTVDISGNLYSTGSFEQTVDFDPGPGIFNLTQLWWGSPLMFILKLDSKGNFVWAKRIETRQGFIEGYSIANDLLGNIYTTGMFTDLIDTGAIGGKTFWFGNSFDAFVFKMPQDNCANMVLVIDSLKDITCKDHTSFTSVYMLNGKAPYNYEWDGKPGKKDSFATFTSPGIYSLLVTDAAGCMRKTSVLIGGPIAYSGFDLNSMLLAGPFRPGRENTLMAGGLNDRCLPVDSKLAVVLDKLVIYKSSLPAPDLIKGDTLIWNFKSLIYDLKPIKPKIYVATKTQATTSDTVCFDVIITPNLGDSNSENNKKRYCYPIRNSYDPNIKSVYPQGACEQNYVLKNKPLTYTVQFQNTGNAKAIDIYILDTLDAGLDINSLRIIGYSHKQPVTEILPGRVIKFGLKNINLPDSSGNEAGSHGYIVFEVMPYNTLVNGTTVKGKAAIYFDFNPPVITNEVVNTLVNSIPSCNIGINQPVVRNLRVYPNPNTGSFSIEIDHPEKDISIALYSLMGEKIKTIQTASSQSHYLVDLNVANGIYLVKVKNGGVVFNQKISVAK